MKTFPYTAWRFGTKRCIPSQITLVEQDPRSARRAVAQDGQVFYFEDLYDTKRQCLQGIKLYLDRKQAEIDKLQRGVTERREALRLEFKGIAK